MSSDVPVHMNNFPPNGAVPPLTEERFMDLFMLFSHTTGVKLNEQDFNIEGRQVNPWALHRTVFARNGFDSVTANCEWPIVGAALGFPPALPVPLGDHTGVPLHCAPVVAHRLQQLYQDTLRHFDQAYASIRSNNPQSSSRVSPRLLQQQPELIPQPTEAEREVLLANVTVLSEVAAPLTSSLWFNPRAGQNFNTLQARMGFPQGQVSLQPSFVQPSPLVPPANVQPSLTCSTSQAPPPGQQVPAPSTNFTDLPLPQLRVIYTQMVHTWMEGEKNFQTSNASGGEGDIQRRQQQRHKLDAYKQRVHALQEFINNKARASGDLSQAANGSSWPGQAQRPTGLYPASERPGQHNSPSLHQTSVNQVPPQRSIPTPQQNFVPPATAQSNLTQMTPHVPTNGLPPNGSLAQMASVPPQQSAQIAQAPSQQPIQPHKIPPLPEDRFKGVFMQFTAATGLRLTDRDLVIEGRPINLWALHRAVFLRNGFESVSTNDEWSLIGVALGFPVFPGGDGVQPGRCAPIVAQRLQQLYNAVLRQFDQAYISSIVARIRAASQAPQPQAQPHQPTEADYQALLASISSESPAITNEAMSILPRFSHASGVNLEAHRVPQHVITFIEQNRENLQRAAQDQSRFRANASNISMGPQMATSSGGAQNQGGLMSVPMNTVGVNSIASGSALPRSAGSMQIRKPTPEEVMAAKRWVDEQKRMIFSRDFDGVASYSTIPENEFQEYHRNLERLDQVLSNIEKYIHIAFAALRKGDVVERMFTMMASARAQLEELEKPNPRYILELHTIRGMVTEADNMDRGLKTVLGIRSQGSMMPAGGTLSGAPQLPARPLLMGMSPQFTRPTTLQVAGTLGDDPASSPKEELSDLEYLSDEEVRTAMDELRI